MAYFLFKYVRRKIKEKKAVDPTADEKHLAPEPTPYKQQLNDFEKVERLGGHGRVQEAVHSNINVSQRIEPVSASATMSNDFTEIAKARAEKSQRRKYRWKMIVGLILPNFLAAADTTIVAPAVPIISSHFSMFPSNIYGPFLSYTTAPFN